MADEIIIRDAAGVEHVFPAGFDPQKAGDIVRNQTEGGPAWRFGKGVADSLNPTGLVRTAGRLATEPTKLYHDLVDKSAQEFTAAQTAEDQGDWLGRGVHNVAGYLGPFGSMVSGPYERAKSGDVAGAAGNVVGDVAAPTVYGGASSLAGNQLRKIAPKVMDTALWRTRAQRLEFPNTPQRLVDEGIVPTDKNIGNALDATEAQLQARARTFDASRPPVRGLLPEATHAVPLGERPTPDGGAGTLTPANRTPVQAQFHVLSGEPTGSAAPDVVEGAGTVRQPMNAAPGRGAPPNMVDPSQLAQSATRFAWNEGKVADLGDVPGEDAAAIGRAGEQYLSENTRPRNLQETIAQKRAYQQRAKYNNQPNAKPSPNAHANFDKGIAAANRDAALQLDPQLGPDLAREQDLIGADTALGYTNNRGTPLLSGGIARHFLLRPKPVGASAIAFDRIGRALSNPTAIRAAVLAALAGKGAGDEP